MHAWPHLYVRWAAVDRVQTNAVSATVYVQSNSSLLSLVLVPVLVQCIDYFADASPRHTGNHIAQPNVTFWKIEHVNWLFHGVISETPIKITCSVFPKVALKHGGIISYPDVNSGWLYYLYCQDISHPTGDCILLSLPRPEINQSTGPIFCFFFSTSSCDSWQKMTGPLAHTLITELVGKSNILIVFYNEDTMKQPIEMLDFPKSSAFLTSISWIIESWRCRM